MADIPGDKTARKRRRDPERTREAIMEVAGRLMAKDGPEGLSVSEVAQLAGVNRGTAYHHYQTREQLVKAATEWVSQKLCSEVFGASSPGEMTRHDPMTVIERLAGFAMENPEFGRAWLFEVLSSSDPADDPFWNQFKTHMDNFVASDYALPGIDAEVQAVLMLVGVFLWPVWARSHTGTESERRRMAQRYSREVMRLNLFGSMSREKFPELVQSLTRSLDGERETP